MPLNEKKVRKDFPILLRKVHNHALVYLDNVATSQRPRQVLDAMYSYYTTSNANIHRGAYTLSLESSELYEGAKKMVAKFIDARAWQEIVFTRNTTEALNLVSCSLFISNMLKKGDVILTTRMEHHSNLVPWIEMKKLGIKLAYIELTQNGELDYVDFEEKVQKLRPKLVTVTHVSNVLGTINAIKRISSFAHRYGALVLVDGAQAVPHLPISVQALDVDLYAFSAHKMLGPFGIGVLYGKRELLEKMQPFLVGGDMIQTVTYERATWNEVPWKFEAGTPDVGGAIGLTAAVQYLEKLGMENVHSHEQALVRYAITELEKLPGITIYGPAWNKRAGVVAFNVAGIHPHDIAGVLDELGIALRSGNHCAQPLMDLLGIKGTCRIGFSVYSTKKEIDLLMQGIVRAQKTFR